MRHPAPHTGPVSPGPFLSQLASTSPVTVVWVYLNDLAHTDMVEFGRVLPEPGGEQG